MLARLFPSASLESPDLADEFRDLLGDDLDQHKRDTARRVLEYLEGAERRPLTDEEQQAWRGLLRMTSQLNARMNRQLLQEYRISLADYEVLVALSEAPEGQLRVFEVGGALAWEQSRVSHQLARMQRRGLITREGCATDARGAFAVLTTVGRAAIERAAPAHVETVRQLIFDGITPGELAALITLTERVLDRLQVAKPG